MTVNLLKKLSVATVSTAAIGISLMGVNPAQATDLAVGFQDEYAPEAWNFENQNADGFINDSNAPNSISLTGGNHGNGGSGTSWYTTTALADGLVSFDWSYTTNDGPYWDPFGYILNGVFTQLTDSDAGNNQFGSIDFSVMEGDSFGFGVNTVDNAFGAATVTVSNFDAPQSVPEPGTMAALGLVGLGGLMSNRKRSSAAKG